MDALSFAKRTAEKVGIAEPLKEVRNWITRPDWWTRERNAVHLFRSLFRREQLVFDIGAHNGAFSERLLRLGARVVAIEPQPDCARHMRERFKEDARIRVVNKAAGATPGGVVTMRFCHASQVSSCCPEWPGRFVDQEWDPPVEVPTTTLDQLIDEFGMPAFVKIDAEGYEPQILKGLSRCPAAISLEFTPSLMSKTIECINRLTELGYRRVNYCAHRAYRYSLPRPVSPRQAIDVMLALAEQKHSGGDLYAWLS